MWWHNINKIIKSHTHCSFLFPYRHSSMCECLQLFSLWLSLDLTLRCYRVEVISSKCLLSISMPQDHLVFFNVLDLCILRYALFVVGIIFFDGLNRIDLTSGKNGGTILFCYNLFQSNLLKNGWYFTYSIPFVPSLFSGFLWINRFTKSTLYRLHP